MRKVTIWAGIIVAGIVLVLAWTIQKGNKRSLGSQIHQDLNALRQVKVACDLYASDWDGEFPPDLETLISSHSLDESDRELLYRDPSDPTTARWTYFPGLRNDSEGETVILKSKEPISYTKRSYIFFTKTIKTNSIVEARVNGSVRMVKHPATQ